MSASRFIVFGFISLSLFAALFAAQAFAADKQDSTNDSTRSTLYVYAKTTIKPISIASFMLSLNNGKTTVRGLRVRRVE